MPKSSKVIILGWVCEGQPPLDGESAKNQQIVTRLRQLGRDVIVLDYHKWKRRPWIVLKTLAVFAMHPKMPLILSSSPDNIYRFIKAHKVLGSKRTLLHWVIGGTVGERTRNGIYNPEVMKSVTCHFVESQRMADDMAAVGVSNVKVVPNFKRIDYIPNRVSKTHEGPLRFVFVSRVMREKGVDYIIESANALNQAGYEGKFTVDIYGGVVPQYRKDFYKNIENVPNVNYAGYLDFSKRESYDTLASYDMMLFPTYWKGEGCAGVFIDAFISGVPIIASDWAHNRSLLQETGTAVFVPVHDVPALTDAMRRCIDREIDIEEMSLRCQDIAPKYDSINVIDDKLLSVLDN